MDTPKEQLYMDKLQALFDEAEKDGVMIVPRPRVGAFLEVTEIPTEASGTPDGEVANS